MTAQLAEAINYSSGPAFVTTTTVKTPSIPAAAGAAMGGQGEAVPAGGQGTATETVLAVRFALGGALTLQVGTQPCPSPMLIHACRLCGRRLLLLLLLPAVAPASGLAVTPLPLHLCCLPLSLFLPATVPVTVTVIVPTQLLTASANLPCACPRPRAAGSLAGSAAGRGADRR